MGYSNGFVASIILKNSPQREFNYKGKRTVKVPFGSEYIIRLKNKSKDPALVDISIDGTDVLNGSQLVLKAGETIDLERFVENNSKGKKFKFISLEDGANSGEIDDPYRDENGLVKISFHKAYHLPKIDYTLTTTYPPFCGAVVNHDYFIKGGPTSRSSKLGTLYSSKVSLDCNVVGAATNSKSFAATDSVSINNFYCDTTPTSDLPQDKGATVEGSDSNQAFSSTTEYFKLGGTPTEIKIYMVGPNYVEPVDEASEWGIYLNSAKDPVATFKDKSHAYLFAGNADFGRAIVTIKPTV